jgi:hypothetical protein
VGLCGALAEVSSHCAALPVFLRNSIDDENVTDTADENVTDTALCRNFGGLINQLVEIFH